MAVLSSAKRVLPWACNGRALAGGSLRTDGGGCSLVPSRWRSSLQQLDPVDRSDEENGGDIDWNNLGFGLTPTDYMYVMRCSQDEGGFSRGELARYGNIELSPSSGVLNYGQGLFEGLKAYRTSDRSGYMLFRPEENARRTQLGAGRMCMPSPSVEQFVHAVKQTVLAKALGATARKGGSVHQAAAHRERGDPRIGAGSRVHVYDPRRTCRNIFQGRHFGDKPARRGGDPPRDARRDRRGQDHQQLRTGTQGADRCQEQGVRGRAVPGLGPQEVRGGGLLV